jgi:serine/threonine protein kinase
MTGKTIKDRYEIVAKIGEGGMGEVYKALDKTLKRPVAIKMLHPAQSNQMLKTRFQVEALVTASLNHRSIVTLYDFFEEEEKQFLVMELLEGETGKDLLDEKGAIAFPELIKIFNRVIAGLAYAHSHGIIHRDIKPNNIMITTSGEVKLMDFGIARAVDSPQMTKAGFTVGSALYMSPEQIRNQKVDHRSDIYSLGITMFEMATGTAPFQDHNASEYDILAGHLSLELPSPRSINPEIPESLERVILKATQKNPDDRFQTMEELGLALTSDAEATMIVLPVVKVIPTDRKQYKPAKPPRHSVFSHVGPGAIFLAVILVASLAAIGTLLVRWGGESDSTGHLAGRQDASLEKGTDTPREIERKQEQLPPKPAPIRIASFKTMRMKEDKIPLEVKESDTLTQNDRYYIVFSPDEKLYIYVVQVDYSAESIVPIFPNRQFSSNDNPVLPHSGYRFPEKGYFFLDEVTGKEYIYVIASRVPNQQLENMYSVLLDSNSNGTKQLVSEFIEVLNQQDSGNVRTIWFWHG